MADLPFTRARVRITQPCRASNPYGDRDFTPGEELEMIQWAPGGDSWWTEPTVDTSYVVPAECVEVLEVLGDEWDE
ncbi:hypothetical protein [Nonomuraea typhae]|uniref:hypothetical protein n=1 Tax=Nonomuraea typhae TaxID=2603600 RepID=UPI0012FA757C|nr:hypothetical protein [Nonomuraea typhae]